MLAGIMNALARGFRPREQGRMRRRESKPEVAECEKRALLSISPLFFQTHNPGVLTGGNHSIPSSQGGFGIGQGGFFGPGIGFPNPWWGGFRPNLQPVYFSGLFAGAPGFGPGGLSGFLTPGFGYVGPGPGYYPSNGFYFAPGFGSSGFGSNAALYPGFGSLASSGLFTGGSYGAGGLYSGIGGNAF